MNRQWLYFAGGAAVVLGAALLIATRSPKAPAPMPLKPIDELARESDHLTGVLVRTQGELVEGTTLRGGEPCKTSFLLERRSIQVPVVLLGCVVPDHFRDHAGLIVTAEGRLRKDGVFEARAISVAATLPGR